MIEPNEEIERQRKSLLSCKYVCVDFEHILRHYNGYVECITHHGMGFNELHFMSLDGKILLNPVIQHMRKINIYQKNSFIFRLRSVELYRPHDYKKVNLKNS